MDIFKRMAQGSAADFNVFKCGKGKKINEPLSEEIKMENPILPVNEDKKQEETLGKDAENKVIQFRKPENLNEEASIKLEAELEHAKSTLLPVFPIVRYLKNKCLADAAFAAIVQDERKTLAKCFQYVEGEVKKALNGKNGWLDDNEVYAYAETYYLTDEAIFEKIAAEKAEAEKKRQEEVARKRKEQEEKRKKSVKSNKKKNSQKELAVEKSVDSVIEENGTAADKTVPLEKETQKPEAPVMQEQLCLEL